MISAFLKNKAVKNASWLIVGRVVQMLINLVVGLLTARYLGPSNYGVINYALAYTSFFSAFCVLGINSILVKEFVDNPKQEGKIIGTALGLRGISSILSAICIVCIVMMVDKDEPTTIVVVALSTIGMLFQIFEVFNFWFQSKLQSKVTAIVTLIAYVVTALYRICLLVLGKSVEWFAFATAVDYICFALIMYIAYKRHKGGKLVFSLSYGKNMLRKSFHFILPTLMVAVYSQTDKIMLKQLISDTEIGYYSTAVSICTVWCFVLQAIIDSMYPEIAKAYNQDEELFNKRNRQLYMIIFYVSVVVSLLITIFAQLIVSVMYGKDYLPAIAPLRVITWYTAFSYLGVARNSWIVCKNRQKYLIYVYSAAAISNVILNLIFIPLFGATGAAIASLMAQIITTMIAPFFIKGLKENAFLMLESILLKDIIFKRKR